MLLPKLCIRFDFNYSLDYEILNLIKSILLTIKEEKPDYVSTNLSISNLTNSDLCDKLYNLLREENISWIPIVNSIKEIDLTRPYYSKLPNEKNGYVLGIPAIKIKDFKLLEYSKKCADYIILYTGLCTQKEIDRAIEICQPDLVIHHAIGEAKLDYIQYLQHISMEFNKKYLVGFKNSENSPSTLAIAASLLGAKFIEYTLTINKEGIHYTLDSSSKLNEYCKLVTDLNIINSSRGGYESRKLNKLEKEFRNNENNTY